LDKCALYLVQITTDIKKSLDDGMEDTKLGFLMHSRSK